MVERAEDKRKQQTEDERWFQWFRLLFLLVVVVGALSMAVLSVLVFSAQGDAARTQGRLEATQARLEAAQARIEDANVARQQLEVCLEHWANATTDRSAALFRASQKRQRALDAIIAAVASRSQRRFERALNRYERLTHRYNAEARAHPIPQSPRLACNQ